MTEMEGVERVITYPEVFKIKLGIGEDAFASLRQKKNLEQVLEVFNIAIMGGAGAAAASSSAVATTFSAPAGLLAALGVGATAAILCQLMGTKCTDLYRLGVLTYGDLVY